MSDKTTSNPVTLLKKSYRENLDARVFHPATNLMPSSPPSGLMRTNSTIQPDILKWKLASLITDELTDFEIETKQQKQLITAQSEVQTPHVPSKYAKTYEVEKFKGNRMIIFNHYEFHDGVTRPGTRKDEEALKRTFAEFGFEVVTHQNLIKRELIDTIRNFARSDFSNDGCICVTVLTHGNKKPGYLEAYDTRYSERDIFEPFDASKNSSLVAKPIIFIIQACRGAKASTLVRTGRPVMSKYQLDLDDEWEDYHLPIEADRIVFHSSAVGRASIRNPHHGSWFIQTLCKKIQEYGYKDDLETIFRLVRREVALEYVSAKDWKQMPVVTSTLLRELYLVRDGKSTEDTVDYPCIHSKFSELIEKPKEPCLRMPDDSPDSSLTIVQPIHMPCSCFLEYFEYLKNCLEGFVHHNPEDYVAKSLLKMTQRLHDGAEYNLQKFSLIQSIWEHFEANMDKFPPESSKFVYRKYI